MSLPWIRFEVGFPTSGEVQQLVDKRQWQAIAVFVCGLSWCGQHAERSGFIPDYAIKGIHGTPKIASQLVDVGLWERLPTGYAVARWDKYQGEYLKKQHASKVANCAKWSELKPDSHRCEICHPEDYEGSPK